MYPRIDFYYKLENATASNIFEINLKSSNPYNTENQKIFGINFIYQSNKLFPVQELNNQSYIDLNYLFIRDNNPRLRINHDNITLNYSNLFEGGAMEFYL